MRASGMGSCGIGLSFVPTRTDVHDCVMMARARVSSAQRSLICPMYWYCRPTMVFDRGSLRLSS